ncbi:uncharacterized protein Gasu_00990 [Galdieria sulphuraria]|uniref:Uncharacterized protein n=1 Tax=Galdieria sulphuraria TaxID=130081 RepID=M2YA26_GALSU|nr:uncharacterized protein Gasu_00990 [Galdieria sulphuraria]EME32734.1 hypothetical protein Gasu_00990 [Galdieria sulphuraria]|eukprot:XP_005709254.1 hypothetical protein Gasu_00990 [Galdieria sulphuraria]
MNSPLKTKRFKSVPLYFIQGKSALIQFPGITFQIFNFIISILIKLRMPLLNVRVSSLNQYGSDNGKVFFFS